MPPRMTAAVMAALALGVAGCGDDTASKSEARTEPSATEVTGGRTNVSMTEFAFKPAKLSAKAGKLRVTATNDGAVEHELIVIRTKKAADALPKKGDLASEAGSVGEIPEQKPHQSASHTFELKPGAYVFICNVPGHYASGMRGTLTVK
jgi:plastocyanin